MKYTLQLDGTAIDKWQDISASDPHEAIIIAVKKAYAAGSMPATAYVALGESRHKNGAPFCVQSYSLMFKKTEAAQ